MKYLICLMLPLCLLAFSCKQNEQKEAFEVNILVDAAREMEEVRHIWRFFGADEPNYAYMPNGRKLLGDLGSLRKQQVYFRAHNMLNTGLGTYALKWGSTNAYTEDEKGNPIYDWTLTDSIFDAYITNGVRPYVELGFMPEALSTNPQPYRHYWNPTLPYKEVFTGWSYPPRDYNKWEELIYQWALHCVERYGEEEVEQWYWQTWNEANIPYWNGTEEEFFKLHDHAIQGVLRALPTARVGGPDYAGTKWDMLPRFLEHCVNGINHANGEQGTPLDFVAFHAKGGPNFDHGYVQMNMAKQLSEVEAGFKIVAANPATRNLPIVIGESDPEGCAACQGEQLGYRNGTMYSSYTAASFVRKLDLASKHGVNFEGALTWAFEFEEQPYFAGFRAISTNGINKPVYNVFKMFSLFDGIRIGVDSDGAVPLDSIVHSSVRKDPDVSAYAALDGNTIYLMAWHYHDDDRPGDDALLHFTLDNLDAAHKKARVKSFLVDTHHSNSYTLWLEMGSPQEPDSEQYALLEESAELRQINSTESIKINGNQANFNFVLERQGVVLFIIELL